MKLILEYSKFVSKNYKKINEGPGAGKEFKFKDITFELEITYGKDGFKIIKKDIGLGESFDISGYDDGMSDISTDGLFDSELTYTIDTDLFNELTVGVLRQYRSDDVDLFDGVDDSVMVGELIKRKKLNINVEGGGNLNLIHGGGYIRSDIKKDTVIKLDMYELNDGYNSWINGVNLLDCLTSKCKLKVFITLTATEKMEDLWDAIFNPISYDEYVKENGDEISEEEYYDDLYQSLKEMYGV